MDSRLSPAGAAAGGLAVRPGSAGGAVSYTHLDVYKRQGVAVRTEPLLCGVSCDNHSGSFWKEPLGRRKLSLSMI